MKVKELNMITESVVQAINEMKFDPKTLSDLTKFPSFEDRMEWVEKNLRFFMATDPDTDRVGIGIKNDNNEFFLLNGNHRAQAGNFVNIRPFHIANK
jgi:phosphomannomutase